MSISQNFPNTRPSLNLNFARSKTLDPRITFSRTTTATYVDEDGLIKIAAADEPRFDHDPETGECLGLLVEESRSNIIPYSVVSTTAGWTISSSTLTNNATTAPDGTNTAARIQVSGSGYVARIDIPVSAGTTYTFSFWLKSVSGSGTWGINIYDYGSGVGHNRTTVNITEEWQRVSYTYTPTGTKVNVYISDDRDSLATISDGYVWGAQLESGSFMTSLIPTSGSTETRNPDSVSMTGDNFSDWYNQSEGSFYMNIRNIQQQPTGGAYTRLIDLRGTPTGDNYYLLAIVPNSRAIYNEMFSNGSSQLNYSSTYPVPNSPTGIVKIATGLQQNNFIAYNFASQFLSDTSSVTLPILNTLYIGRDQNGGSQINGHISQLIYYPVRLPNSTLQTLTK